jgi:hypothetical protein
MSTFGNTADIYAIVHLVPHACQHTTVDGHTCYYCLLAADQGNYVRDLLKKTWKVSLSIGVRNTMIRCVVYLLRIFKMFHGLMNNPVYRRGTKSQKIKKRQRNKTYNVIVTMWWVRVTIFPMERQQYVSFSLLSA